MSGTRLTDESTLSRSIATELTPKVPSETDPGVKSTMVRNAQYKEDVFKTFQAIGIKSFKLHKSLKARNVAVPTNTKKQKICLPYHHILGYCNSRCGNAADHTAHTASEDQMLQIWCEANYKLE